MLAILDGGCRVVGLKEGKPAVDGALRIWKHFGREAGAKAISLRVLELPAGERATLRNESSDEVLYVIAGSGTAGDSKIAVDSGIYLPPAASLEIAALETLTLVSSRCPDDDAVLEGYEPGHGAPLIVAMRDRAVQRTGDRWYREVINADDAMWAGTSNTPIESGSCIFLPHGQVHCVENRGDGEMRLLGVFYPAGSPAVRYGKA
jgi:mannose-6-phosphate isomerase-like protein (cupin superfamily)